MKKIILPTLCALTLFVSDFAKANVFYSEQELTITPFHLKEKTKKMNPFMTQTGIRVEHKINKYIDLGKNFRSKYSFLYGGNINFYRGDEMFSKKQKYGNVKAAILELDIGGEAIYSYQKFPVKPEVGINLKENFSTLNLRSNITSEVITGIRIDFNQNYFVKMRYGHSLMDKYYYPKVYDIKKAHWINTDYKKYQLSIGYNDWDKRKTYEIELYIKDREKSKNVYIKENDKSYYSYEPEMQEYGINFSMKF